MKVWTVFCFSTGPAGCAHVRAISWCGGTGRGACGRSPFQAPARPTASAFAEAHLSDIGAVAGPSGAVYGGAEALNAALSAALGTRLPLLIYRIPGIRFVQNTVYRWVANHRYRFPGATPYCESHPVAC